MYTFLPELLQKDKGDLAEKIGAGITILEYVPVNSSDYDLCHCPTAFDCPNTGADHLLIDVGSYHDLPIAHREEHVIQYPSGFSGEAIKDRKVGYGIPRSDQITTKIQEEYREKNRCDKMREAQMLLEIERMKTTPLWREIAENVTVEVKAKGWVQPLDYWVHHFSLTLPATTQIKKEERQPFVGIASILMPPATNITAADSARVLHAAYLATKIIVSRRIDYLLWPIHTPKKGRKTSQETNRGFAPRADSKAPTIARFLLAHHWFYPHEPYALQLLYYICGDDKSISDIYRRHGWLPPPISLLRTDMDTAFNPDNLVDNLVEDFAQLRAYTEPHQEPVSKNEIEAIRETIWSVSIALAGNPRYCTYDENRDEMKNTSYKRSHVCLLPRAKSGQWKIDKCVVGIFDAKSVANAKDIDNAWVRLASPAKKFVGEYDSTPISHVKPSCQAVSLSRSTGKIIGTIAEFTKPHFCNWLRYISIYRLKLALAQPDAADVWFPPEL